MPTDIATIDDQGQLLLHFHPGQMQAWESEARFVAVMSGTQGGKCEPHDALVHMADGSRKQICEVKPGDVVLCLDTDTNRVATGVVTQSKDMGIKPIRKITLASGRVVRVTAEHPLYGEDGWVEAKKLNIGDFVAVPTINDTHPEDQDEVPHAELCGMLLADGGLTTTSTMFTKTHKQTLDRLANLLPDDCELVFSSKVTWRIRKKSGIYNSVNTLCKQWGIKKKSIHKSIPECFLYGPKKSLSKLIQAFVDCDGHVSEKRIEIMLGSEQLIDDLMYGLLRFGIFARKKYKKVVFNNEKFDAWRLSITTLTDLTQYYTSIGSNHPEKRARLEKLLQKKQNYKNNGKDRIPGKRILDTAWKQLGIPEYKKGYQDQYGYQLLRRARHNNLSRELAKEIIEYFGLDLSLVDNHIYWDEVVSIENIGDLPTWDIEVPEHQNFISDNVFCHNTSWGPFWLWREIQRRGPGDYMIVAPAYPLLSKKCLPEFLKLFKRHLDLGSYNTQSKIFTFSDDGCQRTFGYVPDVPTQVFFCHAQDPESLESATAKAAWCDEAGQKKFKLGSWEAILRRLSIHQGRVLITTTPYDLGWLKQKIYDKRNDPAESIEVIRFDSTANPTFPREEWERAMRDLPRWKFDMFYRAIFTRPAGMIYDCFQEDRHKVKPFKVPDDWPRYLGMDFGAVNTAGIFLAKEPNSNRLFAYREYKAGGKTMALHVKDLLDGEPCHPLVCGGAQSEENWRMECRQAGLMIYEPPIKEVEVGIDRVYGAFQRDELFIFDNCTGLLQDIKSYSRELDDMGEPTEKIAEKETYHYADALRYIISKVRGPKVMLERDGTPRAREPVKNSVDSAARGTFTKQRPGRGAKW